MEAVAEGLWGLADYAEKKGEIGKAVKCLEAICQSTPLSQRESSKIPSGTLPTSSQQIPSCFDLKFRTFSLLSQCYHLVGAIPPQKQTLLKALDLTASLPPEVSVRLWACNFNSQLANALIIERL
ncbi:sister chromatid cohesion protein [Salix suchowensis]|nr:sister chromatid cohesion protein [Salix suchowensis]